MLGLKYCVTCLTDESKRVRVTRRDFDGRESAEHYAKTIAKSRKAEVYPICSFCGVEWRVAYDESNDWPRCINCRAC